MEFRNNNLNSTKITVTPYEVKKIKTYIKGYEVEKKV